MQQLWQQRSKSAIEQHSKYLKLVFNDHFVLVLLFLLGAFGYFYATLLKTFDVTQWWFKGIVIAVLYIGFQLNGQLATYFKKADTIFLLPQTQELTGYLKLSLIRSLILPLFGNIALTLLIAPIYLKSSQLGLFGLILIFVVLMLLKWQNFKQQLCEYYQFKSAQSWPVQLCNIGLISFLMLPMGVVISLVIVSVLAVVTQRKYQQLSLGLFNWQQAIATEEKRLLKIYRFYNLFTDVPGITSQVKRRSYLDWCYKLIQNKHENTFKYLFLRGFIRDSQYSGLLIRLLVIGVVLLAITTTPWLSFVIAILLIYLTLIQLMPFYYQNAQNVMTFLLPVNDHLKMKAFISILRYLLLGQALVYSLVIICRFNISGLVLEICGLLLLISLGLVQLYLPARMKNKLVKA